MTAMRHVDCVKSASAFENRSEKHLAVT